MTPGQIALRALIVGFIVSFAVITGFAYTTLLERKVLARLQHRIGPNRAGYIPLPRRAGGPERKLLAGFLQPAADAVKLFFKEDMTPGRVDRITYMLAPMLTVMPAIVLLAVIPWAGEINIFGAEFTPYFAIAPGLNVAVLFVLAITSISVYGVVLAGWASNSKYAVLGGIRASAQMISYELALGLTVLIPIMLANSMNMGDIVAAQSGGLLNMTNWFAFRQPIAAIVFFIGMMAELQRAPFDLLEAEQELSAGFNVEYSGMRFGMFFMAEYMKMIIFSAIIAVLFFGGYNGPFVEQLPGLGFLYMILKIVFFLFMMIWIRASLPRFRYDQLMGLGWKRLLPISVFNFIFTAVLIVLYEEGIFDSLLQLLGLG
ncbi:MAG: NADH-quinone oxidoreductase subunit NuoH [Anaerolineaceae bacterium]|nr:NADH-quinone oxidoreductase subunit NuoH [Anaerolineaceae bacterium]